MDIQYFLGANSAGGFFSHYDQLMPTNGKLTRILKGGPGCGKSTLMKKVAARAEQLGLQPERILCSSDPDSLDGVRIPEVGYAVVDGTAPHVVEPNLCACGQVYLDLGAGYCLETLSPCRSALEGIQKAGQSCYPKATACLKAAAALSPLSSGSGALTTALFQSLCRKELPDRGARGTRRIVFLSGHSPKGRITCWDTIRALCSRIYVLCDSEDAIGAFLQRLIHAAVKRGWDCLVGDSPLRPGTPEHLLIPGLGLAFVSSTPLSPYPRHDGILLGEEVAERPVDMLRKELLEEAISHLHRAKEYHDLLEEAYAPHVDFSVADRVALDCCAELEILASTFHAETPTP